MSLPSREEICLQIRTAGLRATVPRIAVLRLLHSSERPLSHSDVVEALGTSEWDQATLYRNLVTLVKVEIARVASHVGGLSRYELHRAEKHLHPHFACRDCGLIQCLHDVTLALPSDPSWRAAFAEAELQVVGRCPDCMSA